MNWKTGTLFAAGLAVGVAAGVAGVMGLNDGGDAPASASRASATGAPAAAKAGATPVVASGAGPRCAELAPLLAKGPEDDGRESLQKADAGAATSDISALLLKGKEAAAGERPRDAEVLFINACRKAQAARAGDLPAADAQYQLARHYANAAALGAARPKELYERANRLYGASLQIYEARHGASHEKTKFARDGLVTVQRVTGVLPPLPSPAVAQAKPAAPAPAAAPRPAPAPTVVAAAPAPVPASPAEADLQKARAEKAQAERAAEAERVAQAQRAAEAERVAQAQRAAEAERVAQAQRAAEAERVAQAQRAQAQRELAARAQAERLQAARVQAERAQAERVLAARVQADKAQAERALRNDREQVAALPAQPVPAPRRTTSPSFDCAYARSTTEKLICADEELARMDRDLGRLHQRAKEAAPDRRAFQRASDAEWKQREATCRDRECLRNWYAERRQELSAAAETRRPDARPAPVVRAPAPVARAEPPVRRAQRQEPVEIALPPGTASGDAGTATMGSN